ncbi:ribonuclease inhibitor-like isoform X2 [Pygocentrus nattereri]|uniref:ribonuclease inhibitor-like isoform X2 n=1 Tax=Pygocentrus nattereri TaxID=42514 RepID=UPI0018913EEA|nr:ribonuclease inhibitor-like isoform X2 [Pygocentrus nattereri]
MKGVWVMMMSLHLAVSENFKTVSPDPSVVAAPGSDVILRCSVQHWNDDTSLSAVDMNITWTRPDLGGAIVHFYANHTDINKRQIPHFRRRTALFKEELQRGIVSLRLSNLNFLDEGEYKCSVESKSWYSDFSFHLTVEAIGTPPLITVEKYDSNSEEFSLLCESKGWFPQPDLHWLDSEGKSLTAEDTESQREAELFNVKRRITVHKNEIDTVFCKVTLKDYIMKEKIKAGAIYEHLPASKAAIVGGLIPVVLGLIVVGFIYYHNEKNIRRKEEVEELKREVKQRDGASMWSLLLKSEKEQPNEAAGCAFWLQSGEEQPDVLREKLQERVESHSRVVLRNLDLTEKSCAVLASALSARKSERSESVKCDSKRSKSPKLTELDLSYNTLLQDSGVKKLCEGLKSNSCKLEKLRLRSCSIKSGGCAALFNALKSNPSHLTELDLSDNKLGDSGVKELCDLLKNQNCKLQILQLAVCRITDDGCAALIIALTSNPSHLKELNLSRNKPGNSAVMELSVLLENAQCKLQKLHLIGCNLTEESWVALASTLKSENSTLTELDLSKNKLQEAVVTELFSGLKSPNCKLETLRLIECNLKKDSYADLKSALSSEYSTLTELDLSSNDLQNSVVDELSVGLRSSECKLTTLRLINCKLEATNCTHLASALSSKNSTLRELDLSNNKLQDQVVKDLSEGLKHEMFKLEKLRLAECNITENGCDALFEALKLNPSSGLRMLNLNNNKAGDSAVIKLCEVLKNPHCKLEKLQLWSCSITEEGCKALIEALKSNPSSHLRELNLSGNEPGDSGVKQLSDLLKDPDCKLEKLEI